MNPKLNASTKSNGQPDEQTKKEIKDLQEDYTIGPDGTVVKINDYCANPETPEKQLS